MKLEKVLEGNSAFSTLLTSSITQEKNSELNEKFNEWKKRDTTINIETLSIGLFWKEFNRLQQESEFFWIK